MLTEYREKRELYADFAAKVASLLTQIIAEQSIPVHSVTHRVKEAASVARKLQRPAASYAALADLPDIAGVRVTTYFHDHVDAIGGIVESEFTIDRANSVDKRTLLDPDRFGYASVHYVIELPKRRTELPEYRRFQGLKGELQLRSLLQHAWAEIEHDLGYKSTRSVPSPIRRRFARLAGILELADAEFAAIRDELSTYENELPSRIESDAANVRLDKPSLAAFLGASPIVKQLDSIIASCAHASVTSPADLELDWDLENLSFIGINTVGDLESALREHENAISSFARFWIGQAHLDHIAQGISLFYLTYVLLAKQGNPERISEWARTMNIGSPERREGLGQRILKAAREAGL